MRGFHVAVWKSTRRIAAARPAGEGALQRLGTVDEKHKILVFLFDSPEFGHSHVMPFAVMSTNSKDGTVTFNDVAKITRLRGINL